MNTCLSVDCTNEMKKEVAAIAKKHGMTISQVVRLALEASLKEVDQKLAALRAPSK